MKKILSCLLIAVLLLSLAVTVGADSLADGDNETTPPGQVTIVPNENALPEGYEIDPDFSMTLTLDAENDWTYVLTDLLDEIDDDEYVYFIVEEDVAQGYVAVYSVNGFDFSIDSPAASTGNIVVVKNIKQGEPPIYELPKTGGIGTAPYTAAGTAILLIAAVYGFILHYKRKKRA